MAREKKYFKNRPDALRAMRERKSKGRVDIGVYKMPKGSRHAGMYAVCNYVEYLNSY